MEITGRDSHETWDRVEGLRQIEQSVNMTVASHPEAATSGLGATDKESASSLLRPVLASKPGISRFDQSDECLLRSF